MTEWSVATLLALLALPWLSVTEASHFRGGVIMFQTVPSSSNTVRFAFRMAFRRSYSSSYYCSQSTKDSGTVLGSGDSWLAQCNTTNTGIPQCSSTAIADTGFHCTDFSLVEDWSMGGNNFTYTFPNVHELWIVGYSSCCWISLASGGGSSWLLSTVVNLTRRADTGEINSSPVTTNPAIVRLREGCAQSIRIPLEDPDGDVVRCRWSYYSESKLQTDSFPDGVLDEANCILSYQGSNGSAGTYVAALTLEDFPAGTTDFTSVPPLSSVGLQFLVMISSHSGSCDSKPVLTGSTPQDGQCSEIQIDSAYTATIEVTHVDHSQQIAELTTSSPSGMHFSSLSQNGSVYSSNVTWYPSQYQAGKQVFCFKAVDSLGIESAGRCVTILVGRSYTPNVILESRLPINPISKSGPGLTWWSIQFTRVIKKPRTPSYIRLVLRSSGLLIYKVNTLSSHVSIGQNQTVLYFAMPSAALSMTESYAILIDRGAVVGLGCSYDGPPTPGVPSPSQWDFNVSGICNTGFYLEPPAFINCIDVNECGAHPRSKRNWGWWPYSTITPWPMTSSSVLSSSADVTPTTSSATSPEHGIHPTMSSTMSSNFHVSSSINVQPPAEDFVLHLPADCAQICSNTPGSFTCSCYDGFQLGSDGKTCLDMDECQTNNGGCSHHCSNVPGSFYCECDKGVTMAADNKTCVEPGVTVTCLDNSMIVSLEKQTFRFMGASGLHLRHQSCRAQTNSTHIMLTTSLNGCGTMYNETQDALIFWNEIIANAVNIGNLGITRSHNIRLLFYCQYSRKKLVSLNFTPRNIVFGQARGYGNFTFKMNIYRSSSFAVPYTQRDYPISVRLNEYLHLMYSVETRNADLVVMALNCRATKDGSSYSLPEYTIIQNGCERDSTLDYTYNPTSSFQRLSMKTFRFFNAYDTVYIHCEVLACHRSSVNSRCARSCLSSREKKRREAAPDEQQESTKKLWVSGGPLIIKDGGAESGNTGQGGKQGGLMIGVVGGVGGFAIIAVVALAVLAVKYRIARLFMNRNKLKGGDLYTTQEANMSRRNVYVQEEDMIEKDDSQ